MIEEKHPLYEEFSRWVDSPLEPLVKKAIESPKGVSSSSYKIGERIAAIILAVHPKTEPIKSKTKHYFDENSGNPFDSIQGASFSLILDCAFEVAKTGISSSFVIVNPPVVIIASVIEDQIQALIRDYL